MAKVFLHANFGHSSLESLRSSLFTLNSKSRSFGLALLARNNYHLTDIEKKELIISDDYQIQQLLERADIPDFNLRSDFARSFFLKEIETRPLKNCKQIAKSLLRFHDKDLLKRHRAKCIVATLQDQIGWHMPLEKLINMIQQDDEFLNEIVNIRSNTSPQEFPKTLQKMLNSDGKLDVKWEELLWDFFCSDGLSHSLDEDSIGIELFWLGDKFSEIGTSIGKAAKNLLNDERIQKHRWINQYHWLTVLADEFSGLEKEKLEEIVCIGKDTYCGATSSLLRRIAKIPDNFRKIDRYNSSPQCILKQDNSSQSLPEFHTELINAARESEWLREDIEELVTKAISEYDFSQEFLDQLASQGYNGCLLAGVFAYCCDFEVKPSYAIEFINYFEAHVKGNTNIFKRLRFIATLSHRALTRIDAKTRQSYIDKLTQAINSERFGKGQYILELLCIQKSLTIEQIDFVLPRLAQDTFNRGVARQAIFLLSEWASCLTEAELKEQLLKSCLICFEFLDIASWDDNKTNSKLPAILLFFPLIYWFCGGELNDKSERIFARGIKLMFHHKSYSAPPNRPQQYEILECVRPLLYGVPNQVIKKVFEQLIKFPEVEVRMWAKLFNCFLEEG